MRSLSSIGLGLSVVFTCLFLFLFAEIYYLLWWKRRIIRREIDGYNTNPTREFLFLFCWNKKSPTLSSSVNPTNTPQTHQSEHYQITNKDYLVQPLNENNIETHLITGPPRFLFPIEEETKEDLESEDGKSREGKRSLSDLLKRIETPYLTPLSSPLSTTPITPMGSCHSGYNPFNEASTDAEFNKMIKTSPPPKFKFLRDAEEKLQRKIMLMEEAKRKAAILHKDEPKQDGSFITIIVAKNNEFDKPSHHYHSPHCPSTSSNSSFSSSSSTSTSTSSSQVLSLASSNQNVKCCKTIK